MEFAAALVINSSATNSLTYTLIVPPATNAPDAAPGGTGGLLLTNKSGGITLTGTLADGAAPAPTVPVNETLRVPIYASLYANNGLLIGWLSVDRGPIDVGDHVPNGNLMWLKKSSLASLFYTNGFTNLIAVQGSVWTNARAERPPCPSPLIVLVCWKFPEAHFLNL